MSAEAQFPIVGIGASAGGVDALEALFSKMPVDSGCGFVIVTHLNPEHRSLLAEIVARQTAMSVHVAADGAQVAPNEVHVLPEGALIDIADGRLQVRKSGAKRDRKPIDGFFSSLARDQGEYAVGIVLSGADGDGTLGAKAIKERGGLTLAQVADGDPPQHPAMPDSAIASGVIDLAIPVGEMGGRLVEFARSLALFDSMASDERGATRNRELLEGRKEIYAILRNQVGHDFSGYKDKTFLRRVQRRMQVDRLDSIKAYVERLRQDPKEVGALFRDLLISVTNFFRDADAFAVLEKEVIPKLFAGRGAEDSVRVWVPGCATGEEVFSIAILLREHMETLTAVPRVQVFATDIDEAALSVARAARYPEALLEGVPEARRKRFFTHDDGSYLLTKDVRDLCVFSPHSVIRDPPFSRLDLVSCRNLLIYLGPDVQNRVIPTFHYALRPGGYLFLGTSENATQFSDLFIALDKKHRVFRARDDASSSARVPLVVSGLKPAPFALPRRDPPGALAGIQLRQVVEATVLERFGPAYVVVNREADVVYYSSRTGKYLEATVGAPSRQLLGMARKGLRLELRALLREAIQADRRTSREGLVVEAEDGRIQKVTVTIDPIAEPGEDRLYLVVFSDVGPSLTPGDASNLRGAPDETALHLERELRETRERLQSLIEEYETALEELKSSNEELVSVNEELQSTNEELEASKEELQSVNEELHTVNGELQAKVEQLDRANNDLTNLFESTRVATIFLDSRLVIRSFTPAVSQVFNILPTDRGRPLTDLVGRVDMPDLAEDVRTVFATGQTLERTLKHRHGEVHYLLRLVAYRDVDQKIQGVVLTLVDITSLSAAQEQHRMLIDELNHRVKNMLMVVLGVAEQTVRTSSGLQDFKTRFGERIQSMARSYELVSANNWTQTPIEDLVRQHVTLFGSGRADLDGPGIFLRPRQALSLGMVIHELATNASKYGALSVPEGNLKISWSETETPGEIGMHWSELGGPTVAEPARRGFGLRLIERETHQGLEGVADIEFRPDGLQVLIRFPV